MEGAAGGDSDAEATGPSSDTIGELVKAFFRKVTVSSDEGLDPTVDALAMSAMTNEDRLRLSEDGRAGYSTEDVCRLAKSLMKACCNADKHTKKSGVAAELFSQ